MVSLAGYFSPIIDLLGWPLVIVFGAMLGILIGLNISIALDKKRMPKEVSIPETLFEIQISALNANSSKKYRMDIGDKKNIRYYHISEILFDSSDNSLIIVSLAFKHPILEDHGATLAVEPIGTEHKCAPILFSYYKEHGLMKSVVLKLQEPGVGKFRIVF